MSKRVQRQAPVAGQAMVEMLVAGMFFLVPLFLAIVVVGKFIDVQHTADMAARYATWERTVWYPDGGDFDALHSPNQKTATEINSELAVRVLNDRSGTASVLKSTDKNATTFANGIDPMWHDNGGTAYLSQFADLASTSAKETPDKDIVAPVLGALKSVSMGSFLNFVPPLPTDSLAVASVSLLGVSKSSDPYKRLWADGAAWSGLDFKASGAILSNTWASNSNIGTRAMVQKMVPTAQGAGAFVTAAQAGLIPWDPAQSGRIEVGKIEVDVVPDDRLK